MKLVRREFLVLAGATVALPADIRMVLAQAPQAAGPKLKQILRGDLEGQDQKVQESMVAVVEFGAARRSSLAHASDRTGTPLRPGGSSHRRGRGASHQHVEYWRDRSHT